MWWVWARVGTRNCDQQAECATPPTARGIRIYMTHSDEHTHRRGNAMGAARNDGTVMLVWLWSGFEDSRGHFEGVRAV